MIKKKCLKFTDFDLYKKDEKLFKALLCLGEWLHQEDVAAFRFTQSKLCRPELTRVKFDRVSLPLIESIPLKFVDPAISALSIQWYVIISQLIRI